MFEKIVFLMEHELSEMLLYFLLFVNDIFHKADSFMQTVLQTFWHSTVPNHVHLKSCSGTRNVYRRIFYMVVGIM